MLGVFAVWRRCEVVRREVTIIPEIWRNSWVEVFICNTLAIHDSLKPRPIFCMVVNIGQLCLLLGIAVIVNGQLLYRRDIRLFAFVGQYRRVWIVGHDTAVNGGRWGDVLLCQAVDRIDAIRSGIVHLDKYQHAREIVAHQSEAIAYCVDNIFYALSHKQVLIVFPVVVEVAAVLTIDKRQQLPHQRHRVVCIEHNGRGEYNLRNVGGQHPYCSI